MAVVSLYGLLDHFGRQYTDRSFERALVAFGIAKGLNAAISVAQGTEIALEPAGVGIIFAPGQILDPVNDLIERFSWVMLACATSLGIQGVLLRVFASTAFSILVAAGLLSALFIVWRRDAISPESRQLLFRLVIMLTVLRLFIPFMAIASEGLYQAFLESDFVASTSSLQQTTDNIGKLNEKNQAFRQDLENRSWYEKFSDNIDAAIESLNVSKRVDDLQASVNDVTENTIDLIVIFTLQTILFPLLFLWLAVKLIRAGFSLRF
jgi:hypothetical protein